MHISTRLFFNAFRFNYHRNGWRRLTRSNFCTDAEPLSQASVHNMEDNAVDFRHNEIHVHDCDDKTILDVHYFMNGKLSRMSRPRFEEVSKMLNRLSHTIKKKNTGEKKNRKQPGHGLCHRNPEIQNSCSVDLKHADETTINVDKMLNDEITSGMSFQLDAVLFTFIRNPPLMIDLFLYPKSIVLMGDPIVPTITMKDADGVDCRWFCEKKDKTIVYVGSGATLIPGQDCVGNTLKVICTPWRWVDSNRTEEDVGDFEISNLLENLNLSADSSIEKTDVGPHKDTTFTTSNPLSSSDSSRSTVYGRAAVRYSSGTVKEPAANACMLAVRKEYNELKRRTAADSELLSAISSFLIGDCTASSSSIEPPLSTVETTTSSKMSNTGNSMRHTAIFGREIRGLDEIRAVCFNMLAEPFAMSVSATKYLYPYCPIAYLETEYRVQLTVRELLAYDADIICLQECDLKPFKHYIRPLMSSLGYQSHYTNKAGGVLEGCVTITRRNTFEVLKRIDLPLKNVLRNAAYLQGIYSVRPDLQDVLGGKLGTVGQFTVCRSKNDSTRIVIFANTHLFYHPAAGFARVLQTDVIIRTAMCVRDFIVNNGVDCLADLKIEGEEELQDFSDIHDGNTDITQENDLNENSGAKSGTVGLNKIYLGDEIGARDSSKADKKTSKEPLVVSIVFMGDLNSTPETAVLEYLQKGIIHEHEVWETVNDFQWGTRDSEGVISGVISSPTRNADSSTISDSAADVSIGDNGTANVSVYAEQCIEDLSSGSGSTHGSPIKTVDKTMISAVIEKTSVTDNSGISLPCLTHDLHLYSAAGIPEYTNYTKAFKDTLDYIFVEEDHFVVKRIAPFPDNATLMTDTALPSRVFPSDHLAVAVDLQFVKCKK